MSQYKFRNLSSNLIKKVECVIAAYIHQNRASYTEGRRNMFGQGPLARYVKLRVAHAPRMPGTFSPPPHACDPDMHHGTCVTHVPWCMPGSLTSGFLCSRGRGKRSRHSRRMRNPHFHVSGKRPMEITIFKTQRSHIVNSTLIRGFIMTYYCKQVKKVLKTLLR